MVDLLRTELAEPAVIVRTLDLTLLRMRIQALVSRRAVSVLGIPPALRHAPEVVLVQELARVAFLTQPAQPMLTHGREALTIAWVHG
jgi:hypothetical protein